MKKLCLSFAGLFLLANTALAAEAEFTLVIKDHRFTPATLEIPANTKVKLIVDNQDPTAEEFESHSMGREKVIRGNSKATILIGPLAAGEYDYFGEFNMDTAKGKIVAR